MKRDLVRDLARFGGIARRSQLLGLGVDARSISAGIGSGALRVPRRGWVCATDAPADAVRAVQLGGILGGGSALRSYGVWADGTDLIVSTNPSSSRLPTLGSGERRVWLQTRTAARSDVLWRVSVVDALIQHATVVDRASLIASIDSALHIRLLNGPKLDALVSALPERLRSVRRQLDSRSMSGTESKLRIACIKAGLRVEPQASIDRVGFVDLLIDDWLIVEVDSREFHGAAAQHTDRQRDGNAVLRGFANLRFDYRQVQLSLDWCLEVILARLASGRPPAR